MPYYSFTLPDGKAALSNPFSSAIKRGCKKMFSAVLRMTSNSRINHGEAVYIIKTKSCISSIPQELYIIIAKAECSLRLMIYTFGDEMHANA